MIRFFLKYVIGGDTGKRESAVFAWLIWLAATAWLGWAGFAFPGRDLTLHLTMWTTTTPFVWTWLGAAYGFDWAAKQTKWGARTSVASATLDPLPSEEKLHARAD